MNKQIINTKKKLDKELVILSKKSNVLSYIRLAIFIIVIVFLCLLFESKAGFLLVIVYILVLSFIGIVIYHFIVDTKKDNIISYLNIIDSYMLRDGTKWQENDSHIDVDIDYINDLNLVGKASLFEYINMTRTNGGKKRLVEQLKLKNVNKEEIKKKQEAIKELTDDFNFVLNVESTLDDISEVNDVDFKDYIHLVEGKMKFNYIPLIISILLSIISIGILVMGFIDSMYFYFFIMMMLIQTSYSFLYASRFKNSFSNIYECTKNYSKLKGIYRVLKDAKLKSEINKEIIKKINDGNKTLNKIIYLADFDSLRNNVITNVLGNTLFSLNFLVIFMYKKILDIKNSDFKKSIEALEELETLISFTTIGYLKKNVCFPEFSNKLTIKFKDLRHPLLEEKKCIPNSFGTMEEINIITGSNMSGKTSFMKTIGINLVLAYNGAYVNAMEFNCSIMNIFTSINVKDDISKGISTFYGELLRIKNILDYCSKHKDHPLVVFIDEIFKGTNYNDRIIGARETLNKLSKLNCIVFLTTHDFELCEIKDKKINNYHFSEDYNKNKISFDYKIKKGKCKTTNAMYLMRQMNIIDE